MTVVNETSPRKVAADVCYQLIVHGVSLTELLQKHSKNLQTERDQAFCNELCFGFSRYYFVLNATLKKLVKKPLKRRDRDVQVILLLGLYQIRFMRVENHAAVNESVKLLHKKKKVWAKGLVNAVLRTYLRNLASTGKEVAELSLDEQRQAYPEWIEKTILQDWSSHAGRVLEAGNQRAPMTLRVNLQKVSRSDYLQQLSDLSINAVKHPLVEQAVLLTHAVPVSQLPGFSSGLVSVQDAAAQLAGVLLDCQPGMRVLDACAAPGGKTLHLLQSVDNLQLIALDKDNDRLQRVTENLQRAGVEAELQCADAALTENWFDGVFFDRILLDAPCSATGIIRRHPDIRILRRQQDIEALVEQQGRLLEALWPLLRPGGKMLYSTCSIFKDENENQLQRFLTEHDNCIEIPLKTVQWGQQRPVGRQILSGYDEMDGFYYATLGKK